MKKSNLIVFITLIFFVILYNFFYTKNTYNFKYYNINNKLIVKENLPKTKLIFIYFSTECESCIKTINLAQKIYNTNKSVNFIYITDEKKRKSVIDFFNKNKINIDYNYVFIDKNNSFNIDFKNGLGIIETFPKILIYDKNDLFIREITNLESFTH